MRLPTALRRLLRRPASDDESVRARYAAADELERSTQSHYREITGVDSQGRVTNPDRDRPSGPS
jgi:hypothetical protein